MIENAFLLKSAAGEIDEIDAQIRQLNDDKKVIFDGIKETVEPPTFKAWKQAVKLRQKRRVDKDALEAHDSRVWAILEVLETETGTDRAIITSRAPAGAEAYDPTTGEIHDPPALLPGGDDADAPPRSAAGERLSHPPAAALAGFTDMGDIPEALDRRARLSA
jgi:hypothetical protein